MTLDNDVPMYGRITGLTPAPITYKYLDTDSLVVTTGTGDIVNVHATGVLGNGGNTNYTKITSAGG